MNETINPSTTPTTADGQRPTTDPPAENGGQGERMFTQDEVNRIISDRLARERAKSAPSPEDEREAALVAREAAVKAVEERMKCEAYLNSGFMPEWLRKEYMEVLGTSNFEWFKQAVERLYGPVDQKRPHFVFPCRESGAGGPSASEALIASAFQPRTPT